MRDTTLMQMDFGLMPPWMVKDVRFEAAKKRLDIELDFARGGRFPCPACAKADCPVHDTSMQEWRHLDPGSSPGQAPSSTRRSSPRARRASRAPIAASSRSPCRGHALARAYVSQIATWKEQLQAGAVDVFDAGTSGKSAAPEIDIKSLHAKIGELTLENDSLESALSKAGLLSARR